MARFPVLTAGALALLTAWSSPALSDEYGDLLVLQATALTAGELAAGNHCAGIELKPAIEAARGYLEAMQGGAEGAAALLEETIGVLASIRYDSEPCDAPCPAMVDAAAAVTAAPSATAKYTLALKAIVDRWIDRAEADPPTLTLNTSRYSHDPLQHYPPGEPVSYRLHVGAACHGARLSLDRTYELPSGFEGSGSFVPSSEGLWTIYLRRNDGIAPTPLLYLDPETGLRTYFKEFWISEEPVGLLGPAGLGPFSRKTQPIAPLP